MSTRLTDEIRTYAEYVDAAVPRLTADDIVASAGRQPPDGNRRQPRWRPVLVATAAFVAVIVAVGAIALLRRDGTTDVVGESSPPSLASLTWSRVPHDEAVFGGPGIQEMASLTTGGPGFVAVGSSRASDDFGADVDAAVWTSIDGITWDRVPHDPAVFGGEGSQVMQAVTAGGPGLVAVGYRFDEPELMGAHSAVWTSVDGITWTAVPQSEDTRGTTGMSDVTPGGPGLVAVGSDAWSAAVWTSVDGIEWTRVPHDPEVFGIGLASGSTWGPVTGMSSVVAGGPGLVAVGTSGTMNGATISGTGSTIDSNEAGAGVAAVWTSPDGITWTRVPHDEPIFGGPGYQRMDGVTRWGSGLVAVGSDEPDGFAAMGGIRAAVWTSPDGTTWTRVPDDETIFGGTAGDERSISAVIARGPGLVAVGDAVWTSPDGTTWWRTADQADGFGTGVVAHPESDGMRMFDVAGGGPGLVSVGESEDTDSAAVWIAAEGGG